VSTAEAAWNALRRPSANWSRLAFPIALVVLLVGGSLAFPDFGTLTNFRIVLAFSVVPFIIATGQTFVIVGRGVDLSVGSMAGLAGGVFGVLTFHGQPGLLALAITLLMAAGYGLVQGLLITKLKVSFFIVTLAGFSILRSQASVVLKGTSLTVNSPTIDWLSNGIVAGVPVIIIVAVVTFFASLIVMRATVFGRSLYATGSNPQAALLAGIRTDRITTIAYVISATLAGFAGVLLVGQLGSSQPSAGTGLELISIAAVLLGGTRFSGGHGGVGGTLLGIVFLQAMGNLLLIAGIDAFWLGTASGVVLILAVAIDRTRRD
jgi:ribose/xylose/arabinose/galactoside ABC-type transport system permease subunit